MVSLLMAFLTAGQPLLYGGSIAIFVTSMITLALFIPMALVLGGVTFGAFQVAAGKANKIKFNYKVSAGVGLSVMALFLLSSLSSVVNAIGAFITGTSTDIGGVLAAIGIVAFLSVVGMLGGRSLAEYRKEEKRRRHDGPPRPPWENPLARTKPANMIMEALADEYSVIALGALVALSLVMWNPLPAMIGGGLQLFWLALVPDSQWFRNRVNAKHRAMAEEQAAERREEQLEYLTAEQVKRHREMSRIAESAHQAMQAADYPFDTSKVDHLIDHHIWLMELENYYADQDDRERIEDLRTQIGEVEAQRASSTGRMNEALARRLDVLGRRLEQLEKLRTRREEITEQRRGLEEAVRLVAESALSAPGQRVAAEIDEVLTNLEATEEVVLDFHAEEDELERQIEEAVAATA